MTAAALIVAVVAVAAMAVALLRARARDAAAVRREAAGASELAAGQRDLTAAREQAAKLGSELEDARRTAALAAAPPPAPTPAPAPAPDLSPPSELESRGGQVLSALWALTRIRQEWANRQAAQPGLGEERSPGEWATNRLADVLGEELARIREDTGTPGELRLSLADEPSPADAMFLVAAVQTLLDALSRHCQGYDLYVHEWERRLTAIVVCEGFDGPDRVAVDTSAVLGAIAPAGGQMALDRDAQGRLRARISLAVIPA